MRKKMLLIYNPVAGKGEASRKVAPVIESFSAAGYEVTVQPVLPGHSTDQILKTLAFTFKSQQMSHTAPTLLTLSR